MKALLRDPLTHFLAAGAALFALYALVSGDAGERPDRIVVTEAQVANLAAGFERTWMRPPTRAELRGLVEDYVTEEILYRQALALGLDRDDLIVRRRMRQKMEFLTGELAAAEPDEAELAAYLREHPESFAVPARVTFRSVFLRPEQEEAGAGARATELLERLRADGKALDPAALGDPTLLPSAMQRVTTREIADRFGADFAEALEQAPEGEWSGPVASAYGLHLVRVEAREPAREPALDEVREQVRREWSAQQHAVEQQRFYRTLRDGYQIELPEAFALSPPGDRS